LENATIFTLRLTEKRQETHIRQKLPCYRVRWPTLKGVNPRLHFGTEHKLKPISLKNFNHFTDFCRNFQNDRPKER